MSLKPGWRRLVGWVVASVIIAAPLSQFAHSITRDLRPDSRILAQEWLTQNIPTGAVVGTNAFCSGPSPAEMAGLSTQSDSDMKQGLPYYVMESYWYGPLSPAYRSSGMLQQLDQKYLHYYNGFLDPAPFRLTSRAPSVEELAKARGYSVIKSFSSNGPEIVVLRRK